MPLEIAAKVNGLLYAATVLPLQKRTIISVKDSGLLDNMSLQKESQTIANQVNTWREGLALRSLEVLLAERMLAHQYVDFRKTACLSG